MQIQTVVTIMDFEYPGEDRPELPREVPVYRIDMGRGEERIGVARNLQYTEQNLAEYSFVKGELTVRGHNPNSIYSLFEPEMMGDWRVVTT